MPPSIPNSASRPLHDASASPMAVQQRDQVARFRLRIARPTHQISFVRPLNHEGGLELKFFRLKKSRCRQKFVKCNISNSFRNILSRIAIPLIVLRFFAALLVYENQVYDRMRLLAALRRTSGTCTRQSGRDAGPCRFISTPHSSLNHGLTGDGRSPNGHRRSSQPD